MWLNRHQCRISHHKCLTARYMLCHVKMLAPGAASAQHREQVLLLVSHKMLQQHIIPLSVSHRLLPHSLCAISECRRLIWAVHVFPRSTWRSGSAPR